MSKNQQKQCMPDFNPIPDLSEAAILMHLTLPLLHSRHSSHNQLCELWPTSRRCTLKASHLMPILCASPLLTHGRLCCGCKSERPFSVSTHRETPHVGKSMPHWAKLWQMGERANGQIISHNSFCIGNPGKQYTRPPERLQHWGQSYARPIVFYRMH